MNNFKLQLRFLTCDTFQTNINKTVKKCPFVGVKNNKLYCTYFQKNLLLEAPDYIDAKFIIRLPECVKLDNDINDRYVQMCIEKYKIESGDGND